MIRATSLAFTSLLLLATGAPSAQSVFPRGTTVWDTEQTDDGLTLFPASSGEVVLIDMDGTIVKTWSSPVPNTELTFGEPLDDGHVLSASRPIGSGAFGHRTLYEFDFDGNVVWTYVLPASMLSLHHDFERLANGNTLILVNKEIDVNGTTLVDDGLIEVDPSGAIVWGWDTWEHKDELGLTPEAEVLLLDSVAGDWSHGNAVSVLPSNRHADPAFAEGNIIVSHRHTNLNFVIDRNTDDVVWTSGFEDPLTFGQHDTHMIPPGLNGAGNILIYDNGAATGYPLKQIGRAYTRLIEYDPSTQQIVWEYSATDSDMMDFEFFANIVGSAQRLLNGNTLTIDGVRGRLFEITTDGEIVWEYMTQPNESAFIAGTIERRFVYRAYRLPYSWTGFQRRYKR